MNPLTSLSQRGFCINSLLSIVHNAQLQGEVEFIQYCYRYTSHAHYINSLSHMYRASCSVTSLVLPNFCAPQQFIPNHTLISSMTCCAIYWCHLLNKANLCTIFLSVFISFLSTFRVTMCPSWEETTVSTRHLVLVILNGWLSGIHTRHVEKRNKHTKKNCAPSWLYLQDFIRMHGQQNLKYWCHLHQVQSTVILFSAHLVSDCISSAQWLQALINHLL